MTTRTYSSLNNDINAIRMQYYYDNLRSRITEIIMEKPFEQISLSIDMEEKLSNMYVSVTLDNANDSYDKYNVMLYDYVKTRDFISTNYHQYKSQFATQLANELLGMYISLNLDNSNEIFKDIENKIDTCNNVIDKINYYCSNKALRISREVVDSLVEYKKILSWRNNEDQIQEINNIINNELRRIGISDIIFGSFIIPGIIVFIAIGTFFSTRFNF